MTGVASVVEHIIIDRLFSNRAPLSSGNEFGQGVFILSVFFIILGSGFLIYGIHGRLMLAYPPETAALLAGALSLGLAALAGSTAYIYKRLKQIRIRKYRDTITQRLEDAVSTLEDQFGEPIRENPKAAVLIAALTGFILEDRVF